MRFASLFSWVLVPAALWAIFVIWGSPHIVLSYRFLDNGDRYNPLAKRHYTECTYFGALGALPVPAEHGTRPWIRFFKAERPQAISSEADPAKRREIASIKVIRAPEAG
ncbi:MAG: hypothetical protein AAGD13_14940 [Pseudomonadota bacterium]